MFDRTKLPKEVTITVTAAVEYLGPGPDPYRRHLVGLRTDDFVTQVSFHRTDEAGTPEAIQSRLEAQLRYDTNAALAAATLERNARRAAEAKLPVLEVPEGVDLAAIPTEELLALVRQAHAQALVQTAIADAAKRDHAVKERHAENAKRRAKELDEALSAHLVSQEANALGISRLRWG